MAYTTIRYKTYTDYLDADLGSDGNFRLLSNGEVIDLPPEDIRNISIAEELAFALKQIVSSKKLVKLSSIELQVHPVGDGRVNRKPDLILLKPEHWTSVVALKKGAILFGMLPPDFVAEVVSPGNENSDNYRRDYEWKRQQYESWQIPEYWIIDRHRQQVTVLTLAGEQYTERVYRGAQRIVSAVFPTFDYSAGQLLAGED